MSEKTQASGERPRVGLFVTCLVDLFRPSVGFAAVKLIEDSGCDVDVPRAQTCCGQPAWNSGDAPKSKAVAKTVIEAFESYDYLVAPSGSCAATIKKDYPEIFKDDPTWAARAEALSVKTFELISFLTDIRGVPHVAAAAKGAAAYHHSCSGLRSLGVEEQPLTLLGTVEGLEMTEMREATTCCGFGGAFCVKYPDISNSMVEKKTAAIEESGADLLLAGDLGCLMNMSGKLKRQGSSIKARHVAEILAGMTDQPAIGESE